MERRHFGQHEDCFACKAQTISVSPAAMPTRRNHIPPRESTDNSWNKGIARHPNGMPFLDERLDTIPLAEWSEKRSTYEKKFGEQTHAMSEGRAPAALTPTAT